MIISSPLAISLFKDFEDFTPQRIASGGQPDMGEA